MKKLTLILIAFCVIAFSSCKPGGKNAPENLNGTHKVEVKEVLQTSNYTYLKVEELRKEQWIAVTKVDAQVGDTYYFDHFMEMKNFESKELDRTFESVYFVQELRTELAKEETEELKMPEGHVSIDQGQKPKIVKEEIKVEPAEGGITIAELYANKEKYNGKKVIIRGQVVKTNFAIMEKNWFHIQDGTSADGKFDLTVTSLEEDINENDVVTFEGTIALDKDFGYGYKYDILMEDAVAK